MAENRLSIGLVRRGYSATGGAESYLKRLGRGLALAGHEAVLFATAEWPPNEWKCGRIVRVAGDSALAFADAFEKLRPRESCDVVLSLERVWRCDVYRAGDGIHRAWLRRREQNASSWQKFWRRFDRKHAGLLRLEESLFAQGNAGRVIANSEMVRREAREIYGYASNRISVIPNGIPIADFRPSDENRKRMRSSLGLEGNDITLLFVGSGWERKGLRFAVSALDSLGENVRLLVAGRGNEKRFAADRVQFLGQASELPALYSAADIFILPTLYDPFSNACLEALAFGLPVITTRDNGFSEIIDDAIHGSIIEDPRDVESLRRAITHWSDQQLRERTCPLAIERASHFDIAVNVERTLEVLAQAASAAATSG
jgi:UDP-glucose:(heptosyl)LPS alpha-1,3-glucosyltransferase